MKFTKSSTIHTERLRLRAINDGDVEEVLSIVTDKEVANTYMLPDFETREDALQLFASLKRLSSAFDRFVYGIDLDGKIIGFVNEVEIENDEIEVGFVISPDHKSNGYATEVLEASMDELFRLGFNKVKTGVFEGNLASVRVMEKSSMRRLDMTTELEYRGKVHKCIWFERTSDEKMIRLMQEKDKNSVLDMMRVFYASPAVLSNGSEEIFCADIDNCIGNSPYLEGYVFENDNELLGYGMIAKSFSTEFGKPCIWIEDLYIKPEFRGRGIGSAFFSHVEKKYPGHIYRLEVEEENERAICVYKKNGFEVLPYMEMKK